MGNTRGKVLSILPVIFLVCLSQAQDQACDECISIFDTSGEDNAVVGFYRKTDINYGCPEGCSYTKDGEPPDIWCIKPGPYNGEPSCPAPTQEHNTTQHSEKTFPVSAQT